MSQKYNDHDKAISVACQKFEEMHPIVEQPEWLKYCMTMNIVKNYKKNWVIKFLLFPKPILKDNQYWEWDDDGIPLLVQIDTKTNKKSIVICGGPRVEPEIFFEVEVDINHDKIIILKDTQLNELDGERYEINRR